MSSGYASCPGLPVCSTEAAAPSLSCPGLPAQPGTVGRCSHPHPCSSAVSSWSIPSPSSVPARPSASPAGVNNVPFMLKPSYNLLNSFILCITPSPRLCLSSSSSFSSATPPQPTLFLLQIKALNYQASPVPRPGTYSEKLTVQIQAEAPACLFLFLGKQSLLLALSLSATHSRVEL